MNKLCRIIAFIPILMQSSALYAIRNPFVFAAQKPALEKQEAIVLQGIVYTGTKRSAVVLTCGNAREVISRGESFMGNVLVVIGKNFVVLEHRNQRKKLFLEE